MPRPNYMPALRSEKEGIFQCHECKEGLQVFSTEEALLTHKWDMIRASKRKSHMNCHICYLDHRTFEALVRHYQLQHPMKQQLECPGCQEPFDRLHSLMFHLDSNACPHIRAGRVAEARTLQVQATNLLADAAAMAAVDDDGNQFVDPATGATVNKLGIVADPDISRSAQLGIFNHSGVTLGDFGRFIGVQPQQAAHLAAVSNMEAVRTTTASGIRGNLVDRANNNGNAVPPTSKLASEALLARRNPNVSLTFGGMVEAIAENSAQDKDKIKGKGVDRSLDWGNVNDKAKIMAKGKDKGKGKMVDNGPSSEKKGPGQAVENFRQGDSKGPDLLTDDNLGTLNRRFQGLNVWAGQAMREGSETTGEKSQWPGAVGDTPGIAPGLGPTPDQPQYQNQNQNQGGLGANLANLTSLAGIVGLNSLSNPAEVKAAVDAWKAAAAENNENATAVNDIGKPGEDADANNNDDGKPPFVLPDPSSPDFNVERYQHPYNRRYFCPHPDCRKAGKLFKKPGGLIGHLYSETAHTKVRVQCPSCFGQFETVNALMMHCESQATRCQFRESDDYIPFLNILSAGVAEVGGRNVDMTLSYVVQEGAARMLLAEDEYNEASAQTKASLYEYIHQ